MWRTPIDIILSDKLLNLYIHEELYSSYKPQDMFSVFKDAILVTGCDLDYASDIYKISDTNIQMWLKERSIPMRATGRRVEIKQEKNVWIIKLDNMLVCQQSSFNHMHLLAVLFNPANLDYAFSYKEINTDLN